MSHALTPGLRRTLLTTALACACAAGLCLAAEAAAPAAAPASPALALVLQDQVSLRGAPRDSAAVQALLWRGEVVEVRGERLDHLQVWDHRRERGGFVRASHLQHIGTRAADAPELLTLLRFVQTQPGAEALGLGLAAAYIQAAPADQLAAAPGAEALLALGRMAERLADRASAQAAGSAGAAPSRAAEAALAAHLDVAARYGVRFTSFEREGQRMQVCYEGDAFRRVLSLPAGAEAQAIAALALTRPDCLNPMAHPRDRERTDQWRAEVLDQVPDTGLPALWRQRLAMRRASVHASLAFAAASGIGAGGASQAASASSVASAAPAPASSGVPADAAARAGRAAQRALAELAAVNPAELADDDAAAQHEAAMRIGAVRWAAIPEATGFTAANGVVLSTQPGAEGQTCVLLTDARHPATAPLLRRCTWGRVWLSSASASRDGQALALAVQPTDGWRELWILRRGAEGWSIGVLPPAAAAPGLGYVEFAGWVPGGQQLLVAREFRAEGRYRRSFEVLRLDTLNTERASGEASQFGPFQRWADPAWKRLTVAVR